MQHHWVHPEVFAAEEREAAEQRIRSLAEGHTDLIDVRITARESGHHRHGGQEVRITCQARGTEIVAARTRPDAGLALNEALDAFEREVRRIRDRRSNRRPEPAAGPPERGVIDVVRSDADHGFILTDAGDRVYFHRNAVQGSLDFEKLREGQRVALDIEGGEQGPQATVVAEPPPGTTGP